MRTKMEPWADVNKDGELMIDWEECVNQARLFDSGRRNYDASVGKLVCMIQRQAFELGYEAGLDSKETPFNRMILYTYGHS